MYQTWATFLYRAVPDMGHPWAVQVHKLLEPAFELLPDKVLPYAPLTPYLVLKERTVLRPPYAVPRTKRAYCPTLPYTMPRAVVACCPMHFLRNVQ
eukprot:859858-Rhodomonas_salina.1